MDSSTAGIATEVLKAVERVVRPGRARVATATRGTESWLCILADGPGRYFELDTGLCAEDFPDLQAQGFESPPAPISRTMSIYRSVAKRAMDYRPDRSVRIIVLVCPRDEWDELWLPLPFSAPAELTAP